MGCDAFASEKGVLVIEIRDYERPERFRPRVVRIEGLNPEHQIQIEILEGRPR